MIDQRNVGQLQGPKNLPFECDRILQKSSVMFILGQCASKLFAYRVSFSHVKFLVLFAYLKNKT